jgi:hypothetical protein
MFLSPSLGALRVMATRVNIGAKFAGKPIVTGGLPHKIAATTAEIASLAGHRDCGNVGFVMDNKRIALSLSAPAPYIGDEGEFYDPNFSYNFLGFGGHCCGRAGGRGHVRSCLVER